MQTLGFERSFIAPAFPGTGRRVHSGMLFVGEGTEPSLHIPLLFGSDVRSRNLHELSSDLARLRGLFVVDAYTRRDLIALASVCREQIPGTCLRVRLDLPARLPRQSPTRLATWQPLPPNELLPPGRPIAFVVGSTPQSTLAQVEFLKTNRAIEVLRLSPGRAKRALPHWCREVDLAVVVETESVDQVSLTELSELIEEWEPELSS